MWKTAHKNEAVKSLRRVLVTISTVTSFKTNVLKKAIEQHYLTKRVVKNVNRKRTKPNQLTTTDKS